MSDFDADGFSGRLPLFPLPDVVLFPHALLPLHVFEPRYRAMTAEALEGERLIGMALLRPGWEPDYQGNPPIHEVVGVGRIVEGTRLPDGRYNLLLLGVARARILEEIRQAPFRTARAELLKDIPPQGAGLDRLHKLLAAFYVQQVREAASTPIVPPPDDIPLGALCDLLLGTLPLPSETRMGFLRELDVAVRARRLVALLERPERPSSSRPWPPAPSSN